MPISLQQSGAHFEQVNWPRMRNYFQSYEQFWLLHVVPLRQTRGIQIRDGVDVELEHLAMRHFTTFEELTNALDVLEQLQNWSANSPPSIENYYAISSVLRRLRKRR